jgi:hypothetical protein
VREREREREREEGGGERVKERANQGKAGGVRQLKQASIL